MSGGAFVISFHLHVRLPLSLPASCQLVTCIPPTANIIWATVSNDFSNCCTGLGTRVQLKLDSF